MLVSAHAAWPEAERRFRLGLCCCSTGIPSTDASPEPLTLSTTAIHVLIITPLPLCLLVQADK